MSKKKKIATLWAAALLALWAGGEEFVDTNKNLPEEIKLVKTTTQNLLATLEQQIKASENKSEENGKEKEDWHFQIELANLNFDVNGSNSNIKEEDNNILTKVLKFFTIQSAYANEWVEKLFRNKSVKDLLKEGERYKKYLFEKLLHVNYKLLIFDFNEWYNEIKKSAKIQIKRILQNKGIEKFSDKDIEEIFEKNERVIYQQAFEQIFERLILEAIKKAKENKKGIIIDVVFINSPKEKKYLEYLWLMILTKVCKNLGVPCNKVDDTMEVRIFISSDGRNKDFQQLADNVWKESKEYDLAFYSCETSLTYHMHIKKLIDEEFIKKIWYKDLEKIYDNTQRYLKMLKENWWIEKFKKYNPDFKKIIKNSSVLYKYDLYLLQKLKEKFRNDRKAFDLCERLEKNYREILWIYRFFTTK